MTPAEDVVEYLNGKTLGGVTLTKGTNLFACEMLPPEPGGCPARAVFVIDFGGPPPEPYISGDRKAFFRHRFQVLVRGNEGDRLGAATLAEAVQDDLHLAPCEATYVQVLATESSPIPLGADEAQRFVFSANFEAQRKR